MFDLASADEDFCYLTTRGRVTGQHDIEIWFANKHDTLYMLSGDAPTGCGTRTDPAVTVRIRERPTTPQLA